MLTSCLASIAQTSQICNGNCTIAENFANVRFYY
nr:MAG TPA: hypothetical protein [Caudoviricetes sp.]